MISIQGRGVSAGVAIGPLYWHRRAEHAVRRYIVEDAAAEWARFKAAQAGAVEALGALARRTRGTAGDEAAALFEAHQLMAEDVDYEAYIEDLIAARGLNAEAAVADAAARFAGLFARMDDPYMRARAADVEDVSDRIAAILTGAARAGVDVPGPVILAADDLAPSEAALLDRSRVLGIVTERGSASGHTAILARAMGIPAVMGVGGQLKPKYAGREVLADGSTGRVLIDPDAWAKRRLSADREAERAARGRLERLKGLPNVTRDGQSVRVCCNISNPADVSAVLDNDGDGIGLFRSEFLYLNRPDCPSEEEQFDAYRRVLSAMDGRPVVVRTLDVGADKRTGCLRLPAEENPAMGARGLRLCLNRPELFRTQLRALYRASAFGRLGILFPMVASAWEVKAARALCEQVRRELAEEGVPYGEGVEIGVMIETPAAAVMSDRLAKLADFFSCGTNDLAQYTLACDRQNGDLSRFFDPCHPAVLRLIRFVCDSAHKNGVRVGVCGELAADLALTGTFLAIGVDELSVSPRSVLPLRQRIRGIDVADVRQRALDGLLGDGEEH